MVSRDKLRLVFQVEIIDEVVEHVFEASNAGQLHRIHHFSLEYFDLTGGFDLDLDALLVGKAPESLEGDARNGRARPITFIVVLLHFPQIV